MAVPVGNLLRRLQSLALEKSDGAIAAHLAMIRKAFDQLQPYVHDAERRDHCKQIQAHKDIADWLSRIAALAIKIDHIIISYSLKLCDTEESSWDIFSWFRNFTLKVNHDATSQNSDSIYSFPTNVFGKGLEQTYGIFSQVVVRNVEELIREAVAMKIQSDRESLLEPYALRMPIQTLLESRKTNGRAEELRQIERWLQKSNEESNNVVIGITGKSGTGKTTLATLAHTSMKRYFDCHAWVYISPVHNDRRSLLEDVLKGILRSTSVMVPEDMDTIDEATLEEMIKRRLTKINFLLILDDVQKPELLEDVMNVFPGDCKLNVIWTSQKELIKCTYIVHLQRLNFADSLKVLAGHTGWWWVMDDETLDILTMCNGNLFAITTIGRMLSEMKIREGIKISYWLERTHFIPLSYADLKPVLKSCFLYAASFPSHMEISCKKLQRLWVAEGFVEVGGNTTPEEAAKLQLDELIQRNMIQVCQVSPDGGVITCRLLEPMRKFALKRSQEDHFCTISDYKGNQVLPKTIHHLFLHEEGKICPGAKLDKLNLSQLYSFLAFKKKGQQLQLFVDIFDCRLLSVLELQQVSGNNLPDAVGDLSLLRYLGLRGTKISKVPGSLKKLKRLQTLDIRNTFVRDLPANLDGLTMLRHLLLAGSFSENVVNLNVGIEVFKDLLTLSGIKLTDDIVKGLSHLPQLQKLSVGNVKKSHSAYLFQSVEQMKFLHSLTIKCSFTEKVDMDTCKPHENLEKVRIGGYAKNVIDWISKLHALKHLYLWDSKLDKDPFPALERLPNLFVLSLCNAYDGETICFSPEGFPNLKKLSILHCRRLSQCTEIGDGAMEKLETLIIAYCPNLSKLPEGMDKLKSLEAIHVSNMSEDFTNGARYTRSLMKRQFSLYIQDTAQFASPAQVTKRLPVLMPAQRFRKMNLVDTALDDMDQITSSLDHLEGSINTPMPQQPMSSTDDLKGGINTPMPQQPMSSTDVLKGGINTPMPQQPMSSTDDLIGGINTPMPQQPMSPTDDLRGGLNTPMPQQPMSSTDVLKGGINTPMPQQPMSSTDDLEGGINTPMPQQPMSSTDDLKGGINTPMPQQPMSYTLKIDNLTTPVSAYIERVLKDGVNDDELQLPEINKLYQPPADRNQFQHINRSSSSSSKFRSRKRTRFGLAEIQAATNNFHPSNIIRKVEFAITYKGILPDGQIIAVKRFDKESNVVDDFRNEIQILRHYKNDEYLVSLIGICDESQEMIIIHEFMTNGTLADHLSKKESRLSWNRLLKICLDVARALEFLHNQTANTKRIIHRNLNPDNIWLDEKFGAKISDFGYAKIGKANATKSAVTTDVKRAISHLSPYYKLTGQLTRRTDTYAFGVVLFEVLCWRPAFDGELELEQQMLAKWAQTCLKNGSLNTIIDARLKAEASQDCLKEFARVAESCLLDEPNDRPKMSTVVEKLDSLLRKSQNPRILSNKVSGRKF